MQKAAQDPDISDTAFSPPYHNTGCAPIDIPGAVSVSQADPQSDGEASYPAS